MAWTRIAAGMTLALAAAGCTTQPQYPLMTPIQVAQTFGYDDQRVSPERYEVSYVTPLHDAFGYRYDVSPSERQAKDMAFDLASFRAAQIALQGGFDGFDVVDQHSSSDAEFLGPSWEGGGYWGGGYWGGGFGYGYGWRNRFGWGGPWGYDGFYDPPRNRIQAQVKLTVNMVHNVKAGQYRATDVMSQVSARYPGVATPATPGLPPQATPSAAPATPSSAPRPSI